MPPGTGDSLVCGVELPMSREGINMGVSLPGGLPYQPWVAALVKERTENNAKDDPHVRCLPDTFLRAYGLPHLLKFVHTPGLLVMLNEMNAGYRQVFTDGRPLPEDPVPSWQGYSSATWSGDTLVVSSIGFRNDLWIDWNGSVLTEAAKVQERDPPSQLRPSRNRSHSGRSQGVHQALDSHVETAHRPRHRARGRNLSGEREIGSAHEVSRPAFVIRTR